MENQISENQLNQSTSDTVVQVEQRPKQSNFLVILLSILLFISLTIAGFFAFQTQKIVKELTMLKAEPTPVTTVALTTEPVATTDSTADWKTYTNMKHNFLFRYPSSWKLEELNGNEDFNANLRLVNVKNTIQIYANMDGIGGSGIDLVGVPVVVSGINLYKYESENTYGKTKQVGITDNLKQSLGFFKYLNKTYSIFLTYPSNDIAADEVNNLKKDFDQILSTFKFTN